MVEYELQGVDDTKKQQVLTMLQSLIDPVFHEKIISRVIVTKDFAAVVRRFVPVEADEEYNPVHSYGTACAKTIPVISDGNLHCVIVFDAMVFVHMGEGMNLDSEATVIHELVHVKNNLLKFKSLGGDAFKESHHKSGMLLHNASVIWEEYDAERQTAQRILAACNSVTPPAIVRFNLAIGRGDDVLKMLEGFDGFIQESIRKFRNWQLDPTAITHLFTSKIVGILVVLSYVYALRGISDDVSAKITEIERNVGYVRFFSTEWGRILKCLENLYSDRNNYRLDLLQEIAESYDRVLLTCGLETSDHEEGFFVNVKDVPDSETE